MSNDKDFSLENSEELIANLKSGKPAEFEQLRSALSLLAHVAELPPTSIPPVLPSSIAQPVPVLPAKSSRPRRTIVTSIMVTGLFASASLAAAAVTGIGPAAIVNVGHQAAKLVKVVVGGVTQVVTGNPSTSAQSQAEGVSTPLPLPSISPVPSITEEDESEHPTPIIQALTNLFPPSSNESDSHENDSQKPNSSKDTSSHESSDENSNSSHESQSPSVEDSPTSTPKGEKEHTNGENQKRPSALPTVKPSEDNSDEDSPSPIPLVEPTPSPSDQPVPTPSPSDQPSEDD